MLKSLLVLCLVLFLGPVSAQAMSLEDFIQKGKQVVALSRERGLVAALQVFKDQRNGFVDLAGPGLHVWATDARGVILFDLSGQTDAGTDLSKWANEDGVGLMELIAKRIDSPGGTLIERFKGVPHPVTNKVMDVDFWCGRVAQDAIVCATFWPDAH